MKNPFKFKKQDGAIAPGMLVSKNLRPRLYEHWSNWSKKRKIISVIALALIVVVLSVLTVGTIKYNRQQTANKKEQAVLKASDDVINKVTDRDYAGAQKIINSTDGLKDSSQGAIMAADIKIHQADRSGAEQALLAAEKTYGLDVSLADKIALNYEAMGNKTQAIVYYQKEIQLINTKPDYPVKDADIRYLNNRIASLK